MRTAKIGPGLRLPFYRSFSQEKQDKTFITLLLRLTISWHAVSLKAIQ